MVEAVYLGQVTDVELVYEGEVHLGISDVQMSLEFAGILHSQYYFIFSQVILAEDIKTEFIEFSIES